MLSLHPHLAAVGPYLVYTKSRINSCFELMATMAVFCSENGISQALLTFVLSFFSHLIFHNKDDVHDMVRAKPFSITNSQQLLQN